MKKKYVSTRSIGSRHSSGVGYLIIPEGEDKDKYIQFCHSTCSITICLENGGILDKVNCAKHVFDYLEFPTNTKTFGSLVTWINHPYQNYPIVIGVLSKNDEVIATNKKDKATLRRDNKKGFSEISVNAEDSKIIVNANSLTEQGGDIYIQSQNGSLTSKINISSSGEINIISQNTNFKISDEFNITIHNPEINSNKTIIKYVKNEGFTYEDEFNNKIEIIDGKINIDSENINIGGDAAQQPLILGTNLVNLLNNILIILGRTTTPTVFGLSPITTSPEFILAINQLEALKSKKHNIE